MGANGKWFCDGYNKRLMHLKEKYAWPHKQGQFIKGTHNCSIYRQIMLIIEREKRF
ncbi:hypothetical protein SAMN05661012_05729 [Chitinophaga sancti]|uniref:Uncharacterized protein n=1 Tax=Chitinophaga sancti TaxID=1004 RepID=A0A1K1SM37_9BACT|nr:hypothetical protein SAMN05661012_05729 [Chitinophaga sancti]